MKKKRLVIYGAKSIALGAALAIRSLYPEYELTGFLVSSLQDNPVRLAGLEVKELHTVTDKNVHVLIATPEDTHASIIQSLRNAGMHQYTCLDWKNEESLMRKYYEKKDKYIALHKDTAEVYMAKFYKDRALKKEYTIPDWVRTIQVGAALTDERIAEITDNTGVNISEKNVNYCELTALYWIWKNRLNADDCAAFSGLFHYRRFLNVTDLDMEYVCRENVDAVLPFPTVHEPDIQEHHARYVNESDWKVMMQSLNELYPEYASSFQIILRQPYLYNYNILIAKKKVLKDYCEWLFPILERIEQLSSPRGWERADRYIGYLGENLLTLYFMVHKELKIRHVGRKMLT